ncbi:sugar 3,4-ketoisomerase [Aestuariivirga sp.]|uniref:sugar 3,4-ketoisomerase n=1 Tax=Aestuariivirga sp. TaxID=2650926 RepID=UPI0039E523E8
MQDSRHGSATLVTLKTHRNHRGALSVAEMGSGLPFMAQRIYILHELDGHEARGVHAHKQLRQVLVAMHGEARVETDNGLKAEIFTLSTPEQALLLEPAIWREITFTPGAVLGVLASLPYDAADYIPDRESFHAYLRGA